MHEEVYSISSDVANLLNKTRKKGKRIVAVGTTTTPAYDAMTNCYYTFKMLDKVQKH